MTLIVGVVTEKFAFLVSDRRITWFDEAGLPTEFEDTENKAVLLNGQFLMGYTGLARLGHTGSEPEGIRTDLWTARVLAHSEVQNYFVDLREALSEEIARVNVPPEMKGHAFLAVGYSDLNGRMTPMFVTVSNALAGGYGTWHPTPDFRVDAVAMSDADHGSPDPDRLLIAAVGIVPSPEEAASYVKRLRELLRKDDTAIRPCIDLIIDMVRSVASTHQGVGQDVSVSVLPRASVGSGYFTVSASGIRDPITAPIAGYAPAGHGPETAITFHPVLITPGLIIGGGESEFDSYAP